MSFYHQQLEPITDLGQTDYYAILATQNEPKPANHEKNTRNHIAYMRHTVDVGMF